MDDTFTNFSNYKIYKNNNTVIFLFNILKEYPTPFEWMCAKEDFKTKMNEIKVLGHEFVYLFDVRLVGMLTITHVKEFVEILESFSQLLEDKLLFSAVVADGVIIKAIYEVIKIFYKTKKELKIVNTMEDAYAWIDATKAAIKSSS